MRPAVGEELPYEIAASDVHAPEYAVSPMDPQQALADLTRSRSGRRGPAAGPSEIQHIPARAHQTPRSRTEVLRRPRAAFGRDDRVLRASFIRAADLPLAVAPGARGARGRVELLG